MVWDIVIVIGIVWIIMSVLSFVQNILIKNIQNALMKKGKVYYGKNAGFMRTSLLVFVAVDGKGIILEANKLKTAKVLIPPKALPFPELKGRSIHHLLKTSEEFDKKTTLALENLTLNFQKVSRKNTLSE